jgi:hypothetical protein
MLRTRDMVSDCRHNLNKRVGKACNHTTHPLWDRSAFPNGRLRAGSTNGSRCQTAGQSVALQLLNTKLNSEVISLATDALCSLRIPVRSVAAQLQPKACLSTV